MKKKIAGFLHYRTDLGDGTRTGVVFSDCVGSCHKFCSAHSFLAEHAFGDDSLEKEFYTEKELAEYLKEEKTLCYTKKLGITFLGEDPLSDPFYCKDVAKEIKEMGMSLQIYTCGMCPVSAFDILDGLVDLYIIRLFSVNDVNSHELFLPDVKHSLEVISFLEKRGVFYRILIPVLKGVNSSLSEEIAEYILGLKFLKSVIFDFENSFLSEREVKAYKESFLKRKIVIY